MKLYQTGLCALALSAAAFQAGAQQTSFGHLDGYLVLDSEIETNGGDVDGDGFGVKGRFNIADQWFITGEYQSVDYDQGVDDIDQLRFGVGLKAPLRQNVNMVGWLEYINVDGDGGLDDDGLGVHGGLEFALAPQFIAHGSVGFVKLDDLDGPEFLLGLRYQATPQISIFGDYRMSKLSDSGADVDFNDLRLGVGYHF